MSEIDDCSNQPDRAGRAAQTVAKKAGKAGAKHLGRWVLLVLGAKGIIGIAVVLIMTLIIMGAITAIGNATAAPTTCGGPQGAAQPAVTGSAPGVTAEQNSNARAIINVALGLGLGYQGALIGVLTADVESDLVDVHFGDAPGGIPSSSLGLFQQISAWAPAADRLDPTKSATMFFTGGQAGQKGLTSVPGWQTMAPEIAMQAIQQSEFSQQPGNQSPGLAAKLALATSVTQSIMGSGNTPPPAAVPAAAPVPCPAATPSGGAVVASNGPVVTIPDNQYVAEALRGKPLTTPNAGVAKGIAAGFGTLGTLYVWGGGYGPGGAATDGCARGGGALNSCQGQIGWDCSGLVNYVLVQGGFPSPGDNSGTIRNSSHAVPWAQGQPGDAVGFPGHIAIFLGNIGGTDYILEASDVSIPNHVVPLTRTDHDPVLYRYWS